VRNFFMNGSPNHVNHNNKFARPSVTTEEEKAIGVAYSTIGIKPRSSYERMEKW